MGKAYDNVFVSHYDRRAYEGMAMPSHRQSAVVNLQRKGLTPGQIAKALGVPPNVVYCLGSKGRKRIRKTIEELPPEKRALIAEEIAQLCGA